MKTKLNYPAIFKQWRTGFSNLRFYQESLFNQPNLSRLNRQIFQINLVLIVLAVVILTLSYLFLPPIVPLFYSLPEGDQQLAAKTNLFIIPALMFTFTLIAALINKKLEFADEVIGRSLFGSSLLFNLMLLITLVKIIWLVI